MNAFAPFAIWVTFVAIGAVAVGLTTAFVWVCWRLSARLRHLRRSATRPPAPVVR